MKYSILLFLFVGILSCGSCGDKECDFPGAYEFVIPTTLSPVKDTFHIGDTITVTSFLSDMVFDQKTKKNYHLVDFKFYPNTSIYKLDTSIISNDMAGFDVIVNSKYDYKIRSFSDGSKGLFGQFNYIDNYYHLEYKIIPKKKGLFLHIYNAGVVALDQFQEFDKKCKNKGSSAIVKLNEGAENNVDFLLGSGNQDYIRIYWEKRDERFYKHGGYCFYVE